MNDLIYRGIRVFTFLIIALLAAPSLIGSSIDVLPSDWQKLETQLLEAGYEKLNVECSESLIDEIWKEGKNKEDLVQLILESEADPAAIFLAANLLMSKDWKPESNELKTAIATSFADALLESKAPRGPYQGISGNAWGLPMEEGDMGVLGERLISLGEIAVPYLRKALDDITMLPYEGSEEPTIADMHIVRVRDVAARIVVRIKGFVWQWSSKPKVRDQSIGFMREHLGF